MNLFDQVSEGIKDAMRAKDKVKLEALRGMKKEFLEAKTAKGAELNFYGNVRLDASYQSEGGGNVNMPYNQINSVPLKGNAENSDRLKSTLAATRLGVDFKSQVADQEVKGKIEVDFLGGASLDNLRIRHAYLTYADWLIGQTL